MKTKNILFTTIFAVGMLGLSSCIGDLDVLPLDSTVNTADKAY